MKPIYLFCVAILLLSSCSVAHKRADNLYQEIIEKKIVYDAIIVPGVPFYNGQWDSVMKARVLWSVYLYQNNITKNIIFSGNAVYSSFYEAKIMGLYAQQLGVSPNHIFYDTLAKHSTENIYYSYKLAQKLGFKSLALATDPFQSSMLKSYTRKRFSSKISHVPIKYDILKKINQPRVVIDSSKAFKSNFRSILETESFLTRLQGTMGTKLYYGPDKRLRQL